MKNCKYLPTYLKEQQFDSDNSSDQIVLGATKLISETNAEPKF